VRETGTAKQREPQVEGQRKPERDKDRDREREAGGRDRIDIQ